MTALANAMARVMAMLPTTTYFSATDPAPPTHRRRVEAFIAEHPFAASDPGYIAFLRDYGGGTIGGASDAVSLGIYGFSWQLCPHLTERGPTIHEDGLFTFADLHVDASRAADLARDLRMAFSLDSTGERRPTGVYEQTGASADQRTGDGDDQWFCEDFTAWLHLIADTRGRLDLASR